MRLPPVPFSISLRSPWMLPGLMVGISALALLAALAWNDWSQLMYLIPYTFLGNSLAPLPYDGALLYLGGRYSLALIVMVAIVISGSLWIMYHMNSNMMPMAPQSLPAQL